MSRRARVTFSYKPEQDDELALEVGDIITNVVDVDVGWCEGELNGKKGVFPNNFVEEMSPAASEEVVAPTPEPSSANTAAEKKAKVTFDYEAMDEDELTLHVGDMIDFMCEVEEGWWRGKLNGKVGVFPSNFVELIEEKDVAQTKDKPVEKQKEAAPPEKETVGGEDRAEAVEDDDTGINKRHSSIGKSKNLFGGGMGFGNLINPNILAEKRLKKVHHDEKKEKKEKPEEKNVPTDIGKGTAAAIGKTKAPLSAKSRPAPPVPAIPPIVQPAKKPNERAKVVFDYEPENPDELKLTVGDVVMVTNKDIPDTEGIVCPHDCCSSPPMQKRGVPVLPVVKDEIKKSPKVHKKPAPKLPPKDESDSDATPEVHPPARPEVKKPPAEPASEPPHPAPAKPKPPVAGHKPVLPPKKPLPAQKKPKGLVKKPEESSGVAVKKSVEDTKDHVDSKPREKDIHVSKEEVSNPPAIKTDNVEEGAISFDEIPVTETLNHLTANRAKVPQKRPPSKDGRSTDSAHLSGSMFDEQLAEASKQPPGRPKEGPKEPAWKKEVREAREKKQHTEEKAPPLLSPKTEAVEKRKSLKDEVQVPPVQKVEPFTTSPGEVDKLRKEIAELREMMTKMEKKHNEAIKKLDEKFTREIESLTNDFDEERKHNAALKVEIDRLKRRQSRQDS
ncbi:hypothetical protein ACROYT_G020739 [Oculina patagonica]